MQRVSSAVVMDGSNVLCLLMGDLLFYTSTFIPINFIASVITQGKKLVLRDSITLYC